MGKKNRSTSLLSCVVLLFAVGSFLNLGCSDSPEEKRRKEERAAKQREWEQKLKEPLRITEVSPLDRDFKVYFCTNHYLPWKTSHFRKRSDPDAKIHWSYSIQTRNNGFSVGDRDLNLEVLTFSQAGKNEYKKQNEDSWCYNVNLYFELAYIPTLEYQKQGYNKRGNRRMYELAVKERNSFYDSIDSVRISFTDAATQEELLSFTAKP
jgi:hypothetical protein